MRGAVDIRGLEALRQRLAGLGAVKGLEPALRAEAEAVAAAARATLASRGSGSNLARSVQIIDLSQRDKPAFAIGTEAPEGRFLEFGTTRMRAFPWLSPALQAHSRGINQMLRKVLAAALQSPRKV